MDDSDPIAGADVIPMGMEDTAAKETSVSEQFLDQDFEILNHLYSTRTAEGYLANVKSRDEQVLLWILRYPLDLASSAPVKLEQRLNKIGVMGVQTPRFSGFGFDGSGRAFLAMEYIEAKPLVSGSDFPSKCEGYYLEVLDIVRKLHERGIALGDICEHTFLIDKQDQVNIVGVMGGLELEASQTAMLPAANTLHYVSPEQRGGGGISAASDVFALGVLGYRLFTGRYPLEDSPMEQHVDDPVASSPAPSLVRHDVPAWVDDVFGHCMDMQSNDRYNDAGELFAVVQQAKESGESPGGNSRWSRTAVAVRPSTLGELHEPDESETPVISESQMGTTPSLHPGSGGETPSTQKEGEGAAPAIGQKRKTSTTVLLVAVFGVFAGVLAGGAAFLSMDETSTELSVSNSATGASNINASPELKRSLSDLLADGLTMEQRKEALSRIAESDDPVAYAVLVSSAQSASGLELKQAAQQHIVEHLGQQNLNKSAEVIGSWFQSYEKAGQDPSRSPAYESLLQACDVTLPLEARRLGLHKAYAKERSVALKLSASLAYDTPDKAAFTPVLRQLLSAELNRDDLPELSFPALVMSDATLSSLFHKEIQSVVKEFSNRELAWVLLMLSESNNPLLYDVAIETLSRNIVPPFQAVFLEALVDADRFSVPLPVKQTLVRGTRGEITSKDVSNLGRWWALGSDRVLLAICAIAEDRDVAVEAFDTIAARTLTEEPARSLVNWVKNKHWEKRRGLVKAIGVLAHATIATPEQVNYAFDTLMPYSKRGTLLSIMISSDRSQLITRALDRLSGSIPSDELIPLLEHENKVVRIAAVKALKGRNQIEVLQAIFRAYENEPDPEVRELYRSYHWVTRDRDKDQRQSYQKK